MDPRNAKTREDGEQGRRQNKDDISWHPRVQASTPARIPDLLKKNAHWKWLPPVIFTLFLQSALSHHLVSKHTSLVAVDKTPSRPAGESLAQEQVPDLLPYGQSMYAILGFPATATGAGAYRMNGLLFCAAALILTLILFCGRRRDDAPDRG